MWTQFTRRVGRDKLTLEDAKAYVQKRLESYLEWAIVYHECDPTDQDDLDDFNEDLESTFDDEDMVYGYYPFGILIPKMFGFQTWLNTTRLTMRIDRFQFGDVSAQRKKMRGKNKCFIFAVKKFYDYET